MIRTPENTYDIFTALKDEIDKNRIQRFELTEADDASVFLYKENHAFDAWFR